MGAYLIIPLAEVAFCVGLLILLIRSGLRHIARKPFSLFLACMGLWGLFIFLMRSASNLESAFFWEKFVFIAILSAALLFYKFTASFTGNTKQSRVLYTLYFFYVVFIGLIPTGLVVSGMQMMWYGKAPVIGPAFFPYVLLVYAPITLGLIMLIKHYRQTRVLSEKTRDSYVIAGIITMFIGGTTDYLPSLGISMYPLGIIGNMIFCVLATVAMLRYGLLEMRLVLRRGAAYTLISMFILGVFGSVIFLLTTSFQQLTSPASIAIAAATVFIIAAIFQPLLSRVQRMVDKWFFRERYDPLQALSSFSRSIKDVTDLKQLSSSLLTTIVQAMQSHGAYLLLPSKDSGNFILYSHVGEKRKGRLYFQAGSPIILTMRKSDGLVDASDSDVIPTLKVMNNGEKALLERNQIELLIPLKTKDQLTGILLLSKRHSDQPYSTEDRHLLQLVSHQAAIGIENARLYDELKQNLVRSSKLASLGELAANVAHEVNNSLQSVINFGTILREDMKDGDPMKHDAKAIETEALRARNIVEVLLGIARKETAQKTAVDINDLLRSVVTLVRLRAKADNVTVTESYCAESLMTNGSADQLKQVFLNLFTNSMDAMPNGGRVDITTSTQNEHAVITIMDTGVGIPKETLDKIFDPLFSTKPNGTGLGLTVSQSIIHEHGGTIDVDSAEKIGTKFTVALPRLR